ncbi:glycosyltransferase family 39 protein [Dyella sedimenti]|uniref:glycosyltransferase family 39 protein n=1 Tax=Dyella sedimenti TaxID=2919947 RepID=UPI001FA9C7C7|nr:glycosyltransferase family 39 protein [Dyella sedimenti]
MNTFSRNKAQSDALGSRTFLVHFTVLVIFVVICGAASICLGKDYSWDLRNYHYYNAWEFLHNRINIDVLAANLQGFHNPLLELPFYFAVSAGLPDYFIGFAMGIPSAIAGFFLWKITGLFAGDKTSHRILVARIVAVAAAITGAAGWCQLGTTSGEWPVSALCIAVFYLILRTIKQRQFSKWLYACGPILGAACALKMTAIPMAIAISAVFPFALWTCRSRNYIRICFVAGCTGAVAFIAFAAPWGIVLLHKYGNPLFPYFNGVFHSTYIEDSNWSDTRFLPKNLKEALVTPFRLAAKREARYGDSRVRDPRILIGIGLSLYLLIRRGTNSAKQDKEQGRQSIENAVIICFVLQLCLWIHFFSYYRYAIGLELFVGVLIFHFISPEGLPERKVSMLRYLILLPLLFTYSQNLGKARFNGGPYFPEKFPAMQAGTVVINLVATDPPLGYLSPLLGEGVTVVKPYSNLSSPTRNLKFQKAISDVIHSAQRPIFAFAKDINGDIEQRYLREQNLSPVQPANCFSVEGPTFLFKNFLCELRKDNPKN